MSSSPNSLTVRLSTSHTPMSRSSSQAMTTLLTDEPFAFGTVATCKSSSSGLFPVQLRQLVPQAVAGVQPLPAPAADQADQLLLQGIGQLPIALVHRHADVPDLPPHLRVGVVRAQQAWDAGLVQ